VLEENEKRVRRSRYFILISILGIICVFVVLGAWVIFHSRLFSIQDINISGNERVSQEEIAAFLKSRILEEAFWKHVLGFQNILVWPKKLTEDDLKFLPQLKSIEIEKRFRERKVNVQVKERKPFGIWCLFPQTQINADNNPLITAETSSSDIDVNPPYDQRRAGGLTRKVFYLKKRWQPKEILSRQWTIIPGTNSGWVRLFCRRILCLTSFLFSACSAIQE